jgi:hypothetical protein
VGQYNTNEGKELMKGKKSKLLTVDPVAELADAKEALEIFRQNLRSATAELKKSGLMIKTTITDHKGRITKVERPSPMLKVQREALRAINVLKKQIADLQKEVQASERPVTALDVLMQMKKEKQNEHV